MVLVFTIFMLLQREDLRDRLIRLVGSGDLSRTTEAMNDAGELVRARSNWPTDCCCPRCRWPRGWRACWTN